MRIRSESVFRVWDKPVFAILTACNLTAILAFANYWVGLEGWRYEIPVLILVTVLIVRYVAFHQMRWLSMLAMRRPLHLEPEDGLRVAVVTTFVPSLEPLPMLERTLQAILNIRYPHETWVLDEGDSQPVRALCDRLGVRHFSRRGRSEYNTGSGPFKVQTKYGNYNAWMNEVDENAYDVVVYFDPDHVPRPEYLERVLGYFRDPSVGYVQPAQVYYNQHASFIARGAAEETYAYYSVMQMAYQGLGHPMITGCHQAHRLHALREIGGLAPHDADDLLTSHYYRSAGWRGVYVPEVLARGLTPVDWTGYLPQQTRWARSVLDIKLRELPRLRGRLSGPDLAVAWAHGLYYLQGVSNLFAMVMLGVILATGYVPSFVTYHGAREFSLLCGVLTLTNYYKQRFFLMPRRECGLHLRAALLQLAKWPFFVWAFGEALIGAERPYALTAKVRRPAPRRILSPPHLWTAAAIVAAALMGHFLGRGPDPVFLFWGAFAVVVSLALVFTERLRFPAPYDHAFAQVALGDDRPGQGAHGVAVHEVVASAPPPRRPDRQPAGSPGVKR